MDGQNNFNNQNGVQNTNVPYNYGYGAAPSNDSTKDVMTVGQYVLMFILNSIPVVNIICWIVWLVSPNTNKNKKNFIIASIVMTVISFLALLILSLIMGKSISYVFRFM